MSLIGNAATTALQAIPFARRKKPFDDTGLSISQDAPSTFNSANSGQQRDYPPLDITQAAPSTVDQLTPPVAQAMDDGTTGKIPTVTGPHLTPTNQLSNGGQMMPAPPTDESRQTFSRKRGFMEGLMKGLATGNPLVAVGEGIAGAASKRFGSELAYKHDLGNWMQSKEAELSIENADPNLRNQRQMELQKSYQQNILTRNLAVQDDKYQHLQDLQDDKNQATMDRLHANIGSNEHLKQMMIDALNRKDVESAAYAYALADGRSVVTPADRAAAGQIVIKGKEVSIRKNTAVAAQAEATTEYRNAQTEALPQRLDQAEKRLKGYLDNVETNRQRLEQQKGTAAAREQNAATGRQIQGLNSRVGALKSQQAGYDAILRDPFADKEHKEFAKNELLRIHTEMDSIDGQMRTISGAPGKGQAGTPPQKPTQPQLSPEQESDYQARRQKYPGLTKQQYLDLMKQLGK